MSDATSTQATLVKFEPETDQRLMPIDCRLLRHLDALGRRLGEACHANVTLAKSLGVAVRTVQAALLRVAKAGYVARFRDYHLRTRRRLVLLWRKAVDPVDEMPLFSAPQCAQPTPPDAPSPRPPHSPLLGENLTVVVVVWELTPETPSHASAPVPASTPASAPPPTHEHAREDAASPFVDPDRVGRPIQTTTTSVDISQESKPTDENDHALGEPGRSQRGDGQGGLAVRRHAEGPRKSPGSGESLDAHLGRHRTRLRDRAIESAAGFLEIPRNALGELARRGRASTPSAQEKAYLRECRARAKAAASARRAMHRGHAREIPRMGLRQ